MKTVTLMLCIIFLSSCAGVKIYNDENCSKENEVGLKFYQPKPFLLVEHHPAKDVKIKTSIVYLPDLANERFVKVKNGWGSVEANIAFENGVLKSFGSISDSKGPETVTGLAGAVTALAGLSLPTEEIEEAMQDAMAMVSISENDDQKWELYEIILDDKKKFSFKKVGLPSTD